MGATTRWLLARSLRRARQPRRLAAGAIDAVWEQFDQGTQRAILRLYRDSDEQRLARPAKASPSWRCRRS